MVATPSSEVCLALVWMAWRACCSAAPLCSGASLLHLAQDAWVWAEASDCFQRVQSHWCEILLTLEMYQLSLFANQVKEGNVQILFYSSMACFMQWRGREKHVQSSRWMKPPLNVSVVSHMTEILSCCVKYVCLFPEKKILDSTFKMYWEIVG